MAKVIVISDTVNWCVCVWNLIDTYAACTKDERCVAGKRAMVAARNAKLHEDPWDFILVTINSITIFIDSNPGDLPVANWCKTFFMLE